MGKACSKDAPPPDVDLNKKDISKKPKNGTNDTKNAKTTAQGSTMADAKGSEADETSTKNVGNTGDDPSDPYKKRPKQYQLSAQNAGNALDGVGRDVKLNRGTSVNVNKDAQSNAVWEGVKGVQEGATDGLQEAVDGVKDDVFSHGASAEDQIESNVNCYQLNFVN